MGNENLKRLLNQLTFRDAGQLHQELQSPKPLSQELQQKVLAALRRAGLVTKNA